MSPATDETKQVVIDTTGATAGTSTTLDFNQTANRIVAFPDTTGTLLTSVTLQSATSTTITHDSRAKTTAVSFGTAFTTTPTVQVSLTDMSYNGQGSSVSANSITTTGFDAGVQFQGFLDGSTSLLNTVFNGGRKFSMVYVEGFPAISYYDSLNGNLMYVRAQDRVGDDWSTPVTVDSSADVGAVSDMKVIYGIPAIAYYDTTNTNLKYVVASDATGTAWGSPVVVNSGNIGNFLSLSIQRGVPCVVYYESSAQNLTSSLAQDEAGAVWDSAVNIVTGGDVGEWCAMVNLPNGENGVCYYDDTNNDLEYVYTTQQRWDLGVSSVIVIDNTGNVGQHASIYMVDGFPAVSYYDAASDDLKYARATNVEGSTWGTPVIVDATNNSGQGTSLTVVDGNPAISYQYVTDSNLMYVRASNATGSSWGTPVTVDTDDVQNYTSMLPANNSGIVAYRSSNGLKFVGVPQTGVTYKIEYIAMS